MKFSLPTFLPDLMGISTSLIDLLFSHVVSDHWTGQSNATVSDTTIEEVRVSVHELDVVPSTSTTPPEPNRFAGVEEPAKRHGYTQQDSQSDCEVASDSRAEDTQEHSLR